MHNAQCTMQCARTSLAQTSRNTVHSDYANLECCTGSRVMILYSTHATTWHYGSVSTLHFHVQFALVGSLPLEIVICHFV